MMDMCKSGVVRSFADIQELAESLSKHKSQVNYFNGLIGCANIVKRIGITETVLQLEEIAKDQDDIFMSTFYDGLQQSFNFVHTWEDVQNFLDIALTYWKKLGKNAYTKTLISSGVHKLRDTDSTVNRLDFIKTGSTLIPLGGKLTGCLIRIVQKFAFDSWKKAYDAGIACEEIIRYRIRKDGSVAVVTRYAGERLDLFREHAQRNNNGQYLQSIDDQVATIMRNLAKLRIQHGHAHQGNFVVKEEHGKPVVRIIDFDMAKSDEPKK